MTKNKTILPWIIAVGLLMTALDATIISTALPQMALSLKTYPIHLKIAITSYFLTLAAFIPMSGYLADKFGTKYIFMTAIGIFLLGSMGCGFAHSVPEIVMGRLVQGLGGAMMIPVGRLILLKAFSPSEFIKAFSNLTILGQFGRLFGPVVGGALTTWFSWRWVFFVNIPVGLIGLGFLSIFLENKKADVKPFDWLGFIIFGFAASLFVFSITLLTQYKSGILTNLILLLLSLGLFVFYYFYSKKIKHPIFDLKLFSIKSFRIAVLGSTVFRLGVGGVPFLLPLLYQITFGMSAYQSGLLLLPLGLGVIIVKPFMPKFIEKIGFKNGFVFTPLVLGILLFCFSLINQDTSHSLLMLLALFIGMGFSIQFTLINTFYFVDINQQDKSKATSVSSTTQQLGITLGVCMGAALLILSESVSTPTHISLTAFRYTFYGLAILISLSSLVFMKLDKSDGMHVFSKASNE